MSGFEVAGFEELEQMLQDMIVTDDDIKKAMKRAIGPIASEVEKNTPERTGRLKKSIVKSVKIEGFAVVGIVRMGMFYDFMQEFGTSKSKSHIGFFDRSVTAKEDEAISILANELLK